MVDTPFGDDIQLEGVTQVSDVDVLCGRGGAALRHPGNQTYRRLVNLNKGLYITCLKTEKLKISRSIVAAIREQKGRFLEKDNKSNSWYDIGDKKAVEKTSQALREGQPKLRQKIVEMGGGAVGAASLMERQYGAGQAVYPEQVGLNTASGLDGMMSPGSASQQEVAMAAAQIQRQQHQQQQQQGVAPDGTGSMQPPPTMSEADMLQRLSLNSGNSSAQMAAAIGGGVDEFPHPANQQQQQQHIRGLRPSLNGRGSINANELGFAGSNLSLLSDFSAFGGQSGRDHMGVPSNSNLGGGGGHDGMGRGGVDTYGRGLEQNGASNDMLLYGRGGAAQSNFGGGQPAAARGGDGRQPMPNMGPPAAVGSNSGVGGGKPFPYQHLSMADRRQVFARMKYSRPPSQAGSMHRGSSHHGGSLHRGDVSNHSMGDGMPDIHMVESQLSLISNMTDHRSSHAAGGVAAAAIPERKPVKTQDDIGIGTSSSHSQAMDLGSRHSVMSGLSKISDTSIDASIFSDLSRKIGNVSTRSIAMSDISGLDLAVDARLMDHGFVGDEDLFANDAVERVTAADFDE
uniref:DUF6824 domain-containing protein n=1 Tax=Entomoneis paludosa TaxID=265537 RepID=A0A7S2YNI3_9STRA|mmetsp:Transcript_40457/g.84168  ORF Transcript_40457/g.84168 Transcript_40457/m.84168 type:complete len:570 (+) Transcript_40457:342-2051(+)|eukprot:CAMPEP_0172452216 /NCGR_PEP_ID=MMETSP1065-20121228/9948_1 /TAXON_ID=265537 /ORGANISM="Amphiprora paludosa, Strain CCMP125" /LENGTH=569 /DNA_ID=CAMNT_0013204251 /DNA_START=281 /DNA_END=1990 /DNA_ORIENTATION=+